MDDTEDDTHNWISLEQAVRRTYESMARRWQAQDELHERMKDPAPEPVGGGREDRTAKEGEE